MKPTLLAFAFAALTSAPPLLLLGCGDKHAEEPDVPESTGEEAEEAVEEAGEAAESAGDDIDEAADEAADEVDKKP